MHCFDYAENSENTFLKNLAMDYKELKIRNKQLELENKKLKVLLDVDFFVNSHLPDIPSPSKVISAYVIQEKKRLLYEAITEYADKYTVKFMCDTLGISTSSYYKYCKRNKSTSTTHEDKEKETLRMIEEIARSNGSLFGYRKMCLEIYRRYHVHLSFNYVYRIMAVHHISSQIRKRPHTTYEKIHDTSSVPNLLERNFTAQAPNQKWCIDTTIIKAPKSRTELYLCSIMDLYDRSIVGCTISKRNSMDLGVATLKAALQNTQGQHPELLHSDRGPQFASQAFEDLLAQNNIIHSMSRPRYCLDNAAIESLQGNLKDIIKIRYPNLKTQAELQSAIEDTINYYMYEYPQERFQGKTAAQVRQEGMNSSAPPFYGIKRPKKHY